MTKQKKPATSTKAAHKKALPTPIPTNILTEIHKADHKLSTVAEWQFRTSLIKASLGAIFYYFNLLPTNLIHFSLLISTGVIKKFFILPGYLQFIKKTNLSENLRELKRDMEESWVNTYLDNPEERNDFETNIKNFSDNENRTFGAYSLLQYYILELVIISFTPAINTLKFLSPAARCFFHFSALFFLVINPNNPIPISHLSPLPPENPLPLLLEAKFSETVLKAARDFSDQYRIESTDSAAIAKIKSKIEILYLLHYLEVSKKIHNTRWFRLSFIINAVGFLYANNLSSLFFLGGYLPLLTYKMAMLFLPTIHNMTLSKIGMEEVKEEIKFPEFSSCITQESPAEVDLNSWNLTLSNLIKKHMFHFESTPRDCNEVFQSCFISTLLMSVFLIASGSPQFSFILASRTGIFTGLPH